jgi:hypothetical protein
MDKLELNRAELEELNEHTSGWAWNTWSFG